MSMGQEPELLTVAEVADRLNVSDETVHRYAREGLLPFVPLPSGRKRFRRADVEAIEDNRVTAERSSADPERGAA